MELKIAIVHDWLASAGGAGGAERTLEAVLELFPKADLYTTVYNEQRMGETFRRYNIRTSFIQKFPFAKTCYQLYLPLMPAAVESLNMKGYDVVISFSHSFAKGIITDSHTLHVSYIYTPMRYVWDMYRTYLTYEKSALLKRIFAPLLFGYLRRWDIASSARADTLVAISQYTAMRIKKYYGRDAAVIYPPVDIDKFSASENRENFFLVVSRLVSYKRIDLAIQAFNESGLPLVIIGTGSLLNTLRKNARSNIKFMGRQNDNIVREYLSKCRAFIFPGIEDFGIAPVEAMASGAPVIAYRGGGALETVGEESGMFFPEQTSSSLNLVIRDFERHSFSPGHIRENAMRFDKKIFQKNFLEMIEKSHREYRGE